MAESAFDALPDELQTRVARMLLRDEPLDAARLLSSSRALRQLARGDGVEAAELRAARALATELRLSELRVLAGRPEVGDLPVMVPVLQRLLPSLDAPPGSAWAPPEPVIELILRDALWRVADGDARGRAIARVLRVSSSLTTLDLTRSSIGHEGAKALAAGVAASRSLAALYLSGNQIGDEGAKALAAAVAASRSLAILFLSNNEIGDEGAKPLAAGVAASSSLAELGLSHNKIGDEGAKAIAEALLARGSMINLRLNLNLYLNYNNIGYAAQQSLRDAVRGHQGFNLRLRLYLN